MSKMIIYFCLFAPLLFLSADSSSIRGRNNKNDLVPFMSSRFDAMKRDPNSMKVVSKDPFIIQLHMPNPKEMEARGGKEKDKKRKRPVKKRVSKLKPLRKKHRKRRDLLTSKAKPREEKLFRFEIPRAANDTERVLRNTTRNSVNRMEILKALSSYPKRAEIKRNKLEGMRQDEEKIYTGKTKKNNTSNRNLHKHHLSLSDRSKLVYPTTPKLDRRPQKYTYKDLVADRERLEQKIKYIKNMLGTNVTTTDDGTRVRRRSDSDRTANKIAKMFLTLSAVNGLHDKKKSKCDDEDDDDRVEDVWEKERRNNPLRKSTSSNEERYKIKKWIEFMKNKRSSGKTCPCMKNSYGEESDAFPLEQKLPKGYFLMERGRSSEESSESYRDPYYYSRDKINRNDNLKKRLSKAQEQDNKNKALSKNGKKRTEVPFEDLELYRSRARQILRNAEEILDKIKEEEEKRLAVPNILMSQLKELTARIHGDPRNNENDLIRKIQKNLGWGPLSTPQEETDGNFMDNVKSFILDPYEKAKALTDESAKKLSSYLLRNLGKLQESSEEQEMTNEADKTDDETLKIYLGGVPNEEKPSSASLTKEQPRADGLSKSKEDLQNWEDTLSAILREGNDAVNKESYWDVDRDEPSLQKMEDVVKDTQQKFNDYEDQNIKKISTPDDKESMKIPQFGEGIVAESKPETILEEEKVAMTLNEKEKDHNIKDTTGFQLKNEKDEKEPGDILKKTEKDSEYIKKHPFRGTGETHLGKEGKGNVQASRDMQEEEGEKEEKVAMILNEKEKDGNKLDNTGFQSKSEKEIKSEESGDILKKTEKDADIVKKQPFRGTEGTYQGKEGESDVQASRNMQEKEEAVAMTLNENEKDDSEQYTTGFQLKNGKGIESAEKPGAILEKAASGLDITKNQPVSGMEGTLNGKEGESDVQVPRDMQEEERVEMTLNEKEKDGNKLDNTGFQLKDEKGIKTEESGEILKKTEKDSDSIKKQPFRGNEGIYQGKEGESDVQASRNMQEKEGEEKVAMTLKEKEKDDTKDTTGSQLKNEKDKIEEPGDILKKTEKDSEYIKKQPFRGTERIYEGKEGESDVQTSRDMQEEEGEKEEEKVAMILNEKEKDGNKIDNTGFQLKDEKGIKTEESGEILKKTEKDSDIVKKQPFHGTEGTYRGKEGESDVQASRDMQEEEEFKKEFEEIVRMLTDNESSKTDEVVQKSAEEDVVSQMLEKPEENEKVAKTASLESEKTASMEETSDDSATDERVGKKSDVAFPSITLIDEAPQLTPVKSEQKETGKADPADEFESNEEPILEKQKELYGKQSEEDVSVEENKSENFKGSAETETEKESPLGELLKESRREDSLNEDITQKEIGAKKLPEYADLVKEVKKVEDGDSERTMGNEEILESGNEKTTSKENTDGEVLKAMLDNKENTEEDMQESVSREDSIEDLNTPLRATLDQKTSNQPLDESSSKESDDDVLLKEYKSDEQKKESLEENIKDEILAKERNDESLLLVEKPSEDDQSSAENNDDTLVKESNPDEAFDSVKEGGESLLKEALSNQEAVETQEYKSGEVSDGGFDKDSEINLKASLDKNEELERNDKVNLNKGEDLEKEDGTILKASNRYGLDEVQNLSEEKDLVSQKENQQRESTENVEKILNTQKDLNEDEKYTEDVVNQRENEENDSEENDSEERSVQTIEKAMNTQETLDKENEEATDSKENQNAENINEKVYGETLVRAEKPDENDEETNQELVKSVSNEEMENPKGREDEEIIKEVNPEEVQVELLEEILKEIQDNQKQAEQVDEDELAWNKPRKDDYSEAVLKNETPENLEERPDGEVLKAERVDDESVRSQEETNVEAILDGQDKDVVLKEANFEDSKEKQDDLEDGEDVRAVFDNQDKFEEDSQNFNQDMDDEKILLKADNFEEELNNQNPNYETLRTVLNEQDQENLENYENVQAENPEKDRDETPLKSASLEDEFDNKIDYETALKSAQFSEKPDIEYIQNVNEDESEETLRSENIPQDLSNQIDEKNEAFLESAHFDPKSPYENGYSYEMVTEGNMEAKPPLKASNLEDANSQEWGPLGDPQKLDQNSLKASKLKVPKWIGKIMKDLDGKEKTDVTSMKNLNPEKIDDMLGKIGKAEQQNLLEREEVDCRKECACAEEMNTRSRNIGRYEIVKDFLHWVKDLQLNRVLSDE